MIICSSELIVAPNFDAFFMARMPYIGIDTIKINIEPYYEITTSLDMKAKATNTTAHHINKIGIPT